MSEYVANLNAIHPEQELQQDNINFEDDLALFTNTNFYDFDLGQNADLQPSFDSNAHNGEGMDMKPLDFTGEHKRLALLELLVIYTSHPI